MPETGQYVTLLLLGCRHFVQKRGQIIVALMLYSFFSVMDCKVGEWSDWSSCDVTCGTGTSTRQRQIVHPESNGGAQCPTLEERKPCKATKCSKRYRDKVSALKGTTSPDTTALLTEILVTTVRDTVAFANFRFLF